MPRKNVKKAEVIYEESYEQSKSDQQPESEQSSDKNPQESNNHTDQKQAEIKEIYMVLQGKTYEQMRAQLIKNMKIAELYRKKCRRKAIKNQTPSLEAGRKLFKDRQKIQAFYDSFINQFKEAHMKKPYWQQMLEYRCFKNDERKHNFLKYLTYQTFQAMENQNFMQIEQVVSKVVHKSKDQIRIQPTNNNFKRMYDILNSLSQTGFVNIETRLNKFGKPMKKYRKYQISEQSYKKTCIKQLHPKHIIQEIKARKSYKKKMLMASRRLLNSIRLGREAVKLNQKNPNKEPRVPLPGEVIAFYCTLNLDEDGNHIPCGDAEFKISEDERKVSITSKFIQMSNVFLRAQLISQLYSISYERRGRRTKQELLEVSRLKQKQAKQEQMLKLPE